MVDLTVTTEKPVTVEGINAAMRAAAEGPMKGILQYEEGSWSPWIFAAIRTRRFLTPATRAWWRAMRQGAGVVRQRMGLLLPVPRPDQVHGRAVLAALEHTLPAA